MVALEYLFCQSYHFLDWDVELVANPFEKSVDDVEIDNQDIFVDTYFTF